MARTPDDVKVMALPKGCENAPRKQVIADFLIAVYQRDVDAVSVLLHDDVQWEIVGSSKLVGVKHVGDWVTRQQPVVKLELATVITHGTECAADGSIVHSDGSTTRFSHMLVFAGHSKTAPIRRLRSYLIAD